MATQTLTLGGGCFWCLDAVYRAVPGVLSSECGYAGGARANPSYEQVCTGATGHAEVVRLRFDDSQVDLDWLLTVFFTIHDPTTLNRQGNDVGTQYRSVIFCADADQRAQVERRLQAEQSRWPRPVVTEIADDAPFWPAEAEHQDYYRHHPQQGYCQFVVAPKLLKYRQLQEARP